MLRAESAVWSGDEILVVEVLSRENDVPEHADLEVPGVGNSVGGIYLPDDLLCLIGGVVDIEQGGHFSIILHVLPIIDVKFDHFVVQFPQM